MKCPNCAGTVKVLSQTAMFCLDCDWDNLEERDFSRKTRPVDAGIATTTVVEAATKRTISIVPPSRTRSDTAISGAGEPLAETATSRVGR